MKMNLKIPAMILMLAAANATASQADESIRSVADFSLGMTVEQFKESVAASLPEKYTLQERNNYKNLGGEDMPLHLRAYFQSAYDAEALFTSHQTAYGVRFTRPIKGTYAEEHEELWAEIIAKYGEPRAFTEKKIYPSWFRISATWLIGNKDGTQEKDCSGPFREYNGNPVNGDCGLYVWVKYSGSKGSRAGELTTIVVDHVAGQEDRDLILQKMPKSEKPKL